MQLFLLAEQPLHEGRKLLVLRAVGRVVILCGRLRLRRGTLLRAILRVRCAILRIARPLRIAGGSLRVVVEALLGLRLLTLPLGELWPFGPEGRRENREFPRENERLSVDKYRENGIMEPIISEMR